MGKLGKELIESIQQAAMHAAGKRVRGLRVSKVESPDVLHKSDVGGVRVGCADAAAVRAGYDEMLAEVVRQRPAARLDGVVVQPMVAGVVAVCMMPR